LLILPLGDDFLAQVKLHWSCAKASHEKMTQEKMVNVATTKVDLEEKVEWLKIWNGDSNNQKLEFFSTHSNKWANLGSLIE